MAAIETSVRASAALDDLYRRYVGDVYRYAYAVLGNHADAEDVTQTTFVNALRALERGEEPRNASNWLIVIAHNIVRQRWRQAAARPTEVELVHDVPDVSEDDEVELEGLVRALQRIPPSQREALVMRELEGRSYTEIAELLGLTTSALETLLFRARRSLAEELENLVTCQSAELAISRRLDKRLSRKESRRLDEHLAECAACARLVETQARQRRAFNVLALLPLPVGLALFKGVPTAAAGSLPTIGLATESTTGLGSATATSGAASGGGVAVGGSLVGGAVAKVAAVLIAGVVVAGAAYEGAKLVLDPSGTPAAAGRESAVKGAFAERNGAAGASAARPAASSGPAASADESFVAPTVAARHEGRAPVEVDDEAPAAAAPTGGEEGAAAEAGGSTADAPPATTPPADGPATQPDPPSTPTESASPTSTTTTSAPAGTSKPKKSKKPKKKTTPAGPKGKQPKTPATAGPSSTPGATKDKPNGNGNSDRSSGPADAPTSNGSDQKGQSTRPAAGQSAGTATESSPTTSDAPAPTASATDASAGSADKQPGNDKSGKK